MFTSVDHGPMLRHLLLMSLLGLAHGVGNVTSQGPQILGYLENWGGMTSWWENYYPGNCVMGCEKPSQYMPAIANYSQISYGFTFLTENPNPDATACTGGYPNSGCPVWDDKAIYIARKSMAGSAVVKSGENADPIRSSPGLVTIGEACRLARQGPYKRPKRCYIALGGWSDWTRIGANTTGNAQKIGKLVADMVAYSFADGVDLDFEHLTEFSETYNYDEFAAFRELITSIRHYFDTDVTPNWVQRAKARKAWLKDAYDDLADWAKKQSYYYPTNMKYMDDLIQNGPPARLSITWTTRFNAFLPADNPWNYLEPDSVVPNENFATDNEGFKIWTDEVANAVDFVNIMVYDAGTADGALKINFETVALNFLNLGKVPKMKIILGFEPGSQAAGGTWEGFDDDIDTTMWVKNNGYGGAMVWAINNGGSTPLDDKLANAIYGILDPVYPFPPEPSYTKCNPRTGFIP